MPCHLGGSSSVLIVSGIGRVGQFLELEPKWYSCEQRHLPPLYQRTAHAQITNTQLGSDATSLVCFGTTRQSGGLTKDFNKSFWVEQSCYNYVSVLATNLATLASL